MDTRRLSPADLRTLRRHLGLTQKAMAQALHYGDDAAYRKCENGTRQMDARAVALLTLYCAQPLLLHPDHQAAALEYRDRLLTNATPETAP